MREQIPPWAAEYRAWWECQRPPVAGDDTIFLQPGETACIRIECADGGDCLRIVELLQNAFEYGPLSTLEGRVNLTGYIEGPKGQELLMSSLYPLPSPDDEDDESDEEDEE